MSLASLGGAPSLGRGPPKSGGGSSLSDLSGMPSLGGGGGGGGGGGSGGGSSFLGDAPSLGGRRNAPATDDLDDLFNDSGPKKPAKDLWGSDEPAKSKKSKDSKPKKSKKAEEKKKKSSKGGSSKQKSSIVFSDDDDDEFDGMEIALDDEDTKDVKDTKERFSAPRSSFGSFGAKSSTYERPSVKTSDQPVGGRDLSPPASPKEKPIEDRLAEFLKESDTEEKAEDKDGGGDALDLGLDVFGVRPRPGAGGGGGRRAGVGRRASTGNLDLFATDEPAGQSAAAEPSRPQEEPARPAPAARGTADQPPAEPEPGCCARLREDVHTLTPACAVGICVARSVREERRSRHAWDEKDPWGLSMVSGAALHGERSGSPWWAERLSMVSGAALHGGRSGSPWWAERLSMASGAALHGERSGSPWRAERLSMVGGAALHGGRSGSP
ncbi:hypothetical protein CYMTET_13885, partial [Cymbomonas tetramitiformis]